MICHSRTTLTIKHVGKLGLLFDYAGDGVGFKLLVVCPLLAANVCVEKLVKGGGVIMVTRMAEFVEHDKLAQVFGEKHNEERDADAIATTARSPAGVCRGDA